MKRRSFLGLMPLVAALTMFVSAPASAQGGDIGRQMEQEYGVVTDDTREGRYLNDLLDRSVDRIVDGVNQQRNSGDFRLRSARILGGRSEKHDRVINAFALPDGRIYVTLGLLRALRDSPRPEDELAFVVGHEVTHVAERHGARQARKSLPIGLGALILGAVTKSETVSQIAGLGAAAVTSSYSRKDEYAADKGALIAMRNAGYNLESAVSMLRRLQSKGEASNRTMNGIFGSHPLTGNRIERVQDMIQDLRSGRTPRAD